MDKTLLAVGAPLERQVRPVAEVCGPDICQDHAGPVEALSFLPTGTALYDQAGLDEAAAIERDKLRALDELVRLCLVNRILKILTQ